jgi:hypothetical protein
MQAVEDASEPQALGESLRFVNVPLVFLAHSLKDVFARKNNNTVKCHESNTA